MFESPEAPVSSASAAKTSPTRTKRQRRQAAQRRQLLTFLAIVALVAAIAGIVLGVQYYQDSRAETAPKDLRITALTADGEVDLAPYSVCAAGDVDCRGDEPSKVALPTDGEITLKLPSEIYDHDWTIVQIFDDPSANTENSYSANEKKEITLQGSAKSEDAKGKGSRLTVAEIQMLLIDKSGGKEEPVAAVWSIAPAE